MLRAGALRAGQRGFSLIELMVGMLIGMIVVAGAITLTVTQLAEHRRLMLETQIQQDLRAAADLILRDVRRSGYWSTAQKGVWAPDNGSPTPNRYTKTTPEITTADANTIEYSYSVVNGGAVEDDQSTANERFGFRLQAGELQFQLGVGNWQPLTDRGVMIVKQFNVSMQVQNVSLAEFCPKACAASSLTCPVQAIRYVNVSITGEAKHDNKVSRTVDVRTRLRNDQISGACPA